MNEHHMTKGLNKGHMFCNNQTYFRFLSSFSEKI